MYAYYLYMHSLPLRTVALYTIPCVRCITSIFIRQYWYLTTFPFGYYGLCLVSVRILTNKFFLFASSLHSRPSFLLASVSTGLKLTGIVYKLLSRPCTYLRKGKNEHARWCWWRNTEYLVKATGIAGLETANANLNLYCEQLPWLELCQHILVRILSY